METVIQIRRDMAALGWHSEDRLSTIGWKHGYGYSVWFWRYDWHGGPPSVKVCIHGHTADLERITETVRATAETARRAWKQFPEAIPRQTVEGALVMDELATQLWREAKAKKEGKQL